MELWDMQSLSSSVIQKLAIPLLFTYVLLRLFNLQRRHDNKGKVLPPGPPAVPIIGNLHQLNKGDLHHRVLRDLSRKYGDIMFLRLGSIPTVVVSSSEKVKLFLKKHDSVFATRNLTAAFEIAFTQNDILMAPYGDYWRTVRKMCVNELLSPKRVQCSRPIRHREVSAMVDSLWEQSRHGSQAVDVSAAILEMVSRVSLQAMAGRTYSGEDFVMADGSSVNLKKIFHEGTAALGVLDLGDVVPLLRGFDFQGIKKKAGQIRKIFDEVFGRIIEEHQQNLVDSHDEKQTQVDFLDVLLAMAREDPQTYTVDNIKSILLDLYTGATDSSTAALEWAMSELVRKPSTMARLRQEVESVVAQGGGKLDESSVEKMKYLHCVIKETLRLHPPIALGVPRESMASVTVDGFYIAKKTRIVFNLWAIGRDSMWEDAEEFKPERFMTEEIVDISGFSDMKMLPFSGGRRGCPGVGMASPLLKLCLAALVSAFDWNVDHGNPTELDMTEHFGSSVTRKHHLMLTPCLKSPRCLSP